MKDYDYIDDFGLIKRIENLFFNFVGYEAKYRFTASNVDRYRKFVKDNSLIINPDAVASMIYKLSLYFLLNRSISK